MPAKKELTLAEVNTPAAPSEGATILALIDKMAQLPDLDPARITQMYEIHQKMQADAARKAFMEAFSEAQMEMQPIARNADNKQTKSKYATHTALDAMLRPIYTKYGFGVSFNTAASPLDQHIKVIMLLSRGGYERVYEADIPCDGKGAKGGDVMTKTHAAGSAMTYGKRYLLALAFNIALADRDDDGNAAGKTIQAGGDDPISEQQCAELIRLADDAKADKALFCKYGGVNSIAEIKVKDFEKAKALLITKKRKQQASPA